MGNQPRRPNPDALNADLRRRQQLIRHRRLGVTLPAARERARTRQVIVGLIAGLLVLPIAGAALVLFALGNVAASNAGAHQRFLPADSLVYDRTGGLIADLHPPGATRIPVPLTDISPLVQRAIVAIEDRSFWTEGAVDVPRLAAAAFSDLTH
ncbi:MAG: transglycosylase domain-containing protein, partial [Candidatus Dormiibacterota bacterium]